MAVSTIRDSGVDVALNILRRRKWIGIIAFTATFSLAVPFAFFLPDIYRGVATVVVDGQDGSSAFVKGSVPELAAWLDPPPQAASSATSPRSTVSFILAFCY